MPSRAERFMRWIETDTGGNIAVSAFLLLTAALGGGVGFLLGRRS